jgi:hypothetical protein
MTQTNAQLGDSPHSLTTVDNAVSDTARNLRANVQAAIDPPGTSTQVRRAEMKKALWDDVLSFLRRSNNTKFAKRLFATAMWSELFIDSELVRTPTPDIAVDQDGEILFEWLRGPREVLTISVGPTGIISFASLVGTARFNGVTRIGSRAPSPFHACLNQVGVAAGE